MAVKLANNAVSTLAASITDSANTIFVQVADAGKFPTFSSGDWHPATLIDASGNMEIVRVTGRAANVLAVERAQEGTTAKAFTAGARIDIRLTAGAFAGKANDDDLSAVAKSGSYNDLSDKPDLGTAASQSTEDFASATEFEAMGQKVDDPWALKVLGEFVYVDDGTDGLIAPPKNKAYRYVELTAGLTGAGAYNEGILTGETVSGSSPNITATAVVSLAGSPFNGKTIRLINTSREFLRPGAPGTLQSSQNLSHGHGIDDPGHSHTITGRPVGQQVQNGTNGQSSVLMENQTTSVSGTGISIQNNGGDEARPRNIGLRIYRRIK